MIEEPEILFQFIVCPLDVIFSKIFIIWLWLDRLITFCFTKLLQYISFKYSPPHLQSYGFNTSASSPHLLYALYYLDQIELSILDDCFKYNSFMLFIYTHIFIFKLFKNFLCILFCKCGRQFSVQLDYLYSLKTKKTCLKRNI